MVKFDHKSLKFQIIAFLVCVLLVVTLALGYSYQAIVNYNGLKYGEWCKNEMASFETSFMEKYYRITSIMSALSYTELVQRVLMNSEEYSYEVSKPLSMSENIMKMMYAYSGLDSSIQDIYLLDQEDHAYFYVTYQEQEEFAKLLNQIPRSTVTETSGTFTMNGKKTFVISAPIQRFNLSNSYSAGIEEAVIGTCVATVDMDFLYEAMSRIHPGESNVYLCDPAGEISVSGTEEETDRAADEQLIKELLAPDQQADVFSVHANRKVATGKQLGSLGWTMVVISPESERMFFDWGGFVSVTLVWILLLICLIVICFKLLSGLNNFVFRLMKHMAIAGTGNLEVQMPPSEKTEFNRVSTGFNSMTSQIKQLSNQNMELSTDLYREEVERVNATLLALQNQMNPHFLYNTIECIKNIGICYDVKEIETLSTSLSFVLRYSMKPENTVTIQQEMECIRHYLQIQTIRFENRFTIVDTIDPELLDFRILKLCFEPLVENAMKHAFEDMPTDCRLSVMIAQNEEEVVLSVSDNGIGIPPEKVEQILGGQQGDSGSIGMTNVIRRLALFYKEHAKLSIESAEGKGTTVSIRIRKCFTLQ